MKIKYSTKSIKQPALDVEKAYNDGCLVEKLFGIRNLLYTITSEVNKYDDVFEEFSDLLEHFKYLEIAKKHNDDDDDGSVDLTIMYIKKISNKEDTVYSGDFIERCLNVFRLSMNLLAQVNNGFGVRLTLEDVIMLDIGDESTTLELLESLYEVENSNLSTATKSVFYSGAMDVAELLLTKGMPLKYEEISRNILNTCSELLDSQQQVH